MASFSSLASSSSSSSSSSTTASADPHPEVCSFCQDDMMVDQLIAKFKAVDGESCGHAFHWVCAEEHLQKCPNYIEVNGIEEPDYTCSRCPLCRLVVNDVEPTACPVPVKSETASTAGSSSPSGGYRLGGSLASFQFGSSGSSSTGRLPPNRSSVGGGFAFRGSPNVGSQGHLATFQFGAGGNASTGRLPPGNNSLGGGFAFGGGPNARDVSPTRPRVRARSPSVEILEPPQPIPRHRQDPVRRTRGVRVVRRHPVPRPPLPPMCGYCGQTNHRDRRDRFRCREETYGPYECPYAGCESVFSLKFQLNRHHLRIHGYRAYTRDLVGINDPERRN